MRDIRRIIWATVVVSLLLNVAVIAYFLSPPTARPLPYPGLGECETPPVDFVFTWVDGSVAPEKCTDRYQCGAQRFRDNDELRFALRSLDKYAKHMIGNVYILARDGRGPAWLKESPNLHVLSHAAIFDDKTNLPTMNSHAIEWSMSNIPNLREHFVYLNDDFMLMKKISFFDFFTCDGKVILRADSAATGFFPYLGFVHDWFKMLGYTNSVLNRLFGSHIRTYLQHAPYGFLRSAFDNVKKQPLLKPIIKETISHTYRSTNGTIVFTSFGT